MKSLVIIDGKSVFYRGYYAMSHLSKGDGTPTGGVFGFATIAMEIVRKLRPDKVVVAWDKAKTSTTKRKEIYADYKAGRVRPPEDFFAQIPLLRQLIEALGWGFLECDNYEADDIIGTLAKQARAFADASEYEVYIISSDLDMLQVVDENVKMYRLLKGFSRIEEIDVSALEAKYGIKKEQFLDLKALKGDASDNIPGVPGVGEKTAVKLLNDYESLDGIYEHLDKITGALHTKLTNGKDSAYMSYKLGKIMTDAPVSLQEIPDLVIDGPKILEMLKELEFFSLIRKYQELLKAETNTAPTQEQTRNFEPAVQGTLLEGELKHAHPFKAPVSDIMISGDMKQAMHLDEEVAKKVLAGAEFWDLGQGAFLLDPLSRQYEYEDETEEYLRQQKAFEATPRLYRVFQELDLPLIPVLYKMEKRGMLVNRAHFATMRSEYEKRVRKIEQKIYTEAGEEFNLNSPIQLSEVLYGKLGLPTKGIKKTARGYSTGAKELEKLQNLHPIVREIMQYREVAKLLNTYIVPLPELADVDGRIHTTFTQNVTATGRLSSVNPNLQNIPVRTEDGCRIRAGFVAPEGKVLVSADYAQFELRLAAVLARDKALIDDFNSGIDIHTKTAAEVYGVELAEVLPEQRRAAKIINFGVLYGMSAKGLSDQTKMTVTEAKRFIDDYFELRRPIREYLDQTLVKAREEGYVETYYGRRRPTPDVKSANYIVRTGAERAAQNMPIQGTEADLMKRAMIEIDKKLPQGAELILQVHDSLVVECDESLVDEVAATMKKIMENIEPELKIRLAVDVTVGKDWGSLHA